ncbi:uncharacterized protein [Musca autumnalis]|uniref:uncharacterized protein n=1 Tax=Musca autumnalis TaxID=221902 RepID=UPI003CFA881D
MGAIAEIQSEVMVSTIFKNAKNLTGTGIKIERDLSDERQQDRKVLMQLKTEILQIDKTHRIFVKGNSIKIGTKWMRFSKSRELMSGKNKADVGLRVLYDDINNYEEDEDDKTYCIGGCRQSFLHLA